MNKIIYPEIFQGNKKSRNYFEGWYLKHTSEDGLDPLIVIPGVSHESNGSHAFIQIITGNPQKAYYIEYDITDFSFSTDSFTFGIGSNTFSSDGVQLDICTDSLSLKGNISYGRFTRIDRSLLSPNIMGFFAYFGFMECNHGVISLDHDISGRIECNGRTMDFDSGRGYIEKDWGTSFPEKYIWMQCNHFSGNANLFMSIARVPFMGLRFTGLIAIFSIGGKQIRFATYNGAKFRIIRISRDFTEIELTRGPYRLHVTAANKDTHGLKAPKMGRMSHEIYESINASVELEFFEKGKPVYKDSGTNLGLEIMWPE